MRISPASLICTIQARKLINTASWHSDYLNILISLDEPVMFSIDGQNISGTACVWFSKNDVTFQVRREASVILLLLKPESVLDLTGNEDFFKETLYNFTTEQTACIHDELEKLLRLELRNEYDTILSKSACILNLLQTILDSSHHQDHLPVPLTQLTDHRFSIYRALFSYIDSNYASGITQADTAATFNITPQYLARFLKENLNMTFRELLTSRRLVKMESYRKYTRLTEEEIAFHTSPDYRETDTQKHPAVLLPGIQNNDFSKVRIVKTQPTEISMLPDRKYINASLNTQHHSRRFWRRLINLGYALSLQESSLEPTLEKMQRDIHFEYARICRITDLVSTYTAGGRLYYDFSRVFLLLDQLLKYDLTPFLELGNKSFLIQENTAMSILPLSPTESVEYYKTLEALLPQFMQACINYYGQSTVDTWYFEISYTFTTADITQEDSFNIYQYIKEFKKIYQILRRFSSVYKIGGPGFNDWPDTERVTNVIHLLSTQTVSPDFYSAYAYPIEKADDDSMKLSCDPELLYKRIQLFSELVRKKSPEKEIWITEFNSNLSSRNYLNDSCYQAAFILDMIRQLKPLNIHALGYYLLSDTPLRYSDSLDFLFGGWGLITDDNVPKPSYHAYHALAMSGYYHVKSSPDCMVTADSFGHFQILLHRYSPLLPEYSERNLTRQDLLSESTMIEHTGISHYHIRIGNVQPGTYIIEDYRINADHSNLFKYWSQMNYLTPAHNGIRKEIAQISDMLPQIHSCTVGADGYFTIDATLHDLDIHLIVVTLYDTTDEEDHT